MATGRRKRKTTAKRKRTSKRAPARKKARKAKPKARKKTAPKRKPKAKARPRKARKPKPRPRPKPMRPAPAPAAAEPEPIAAAAAAPTGDAMRANVEQALRDQGYDPPDETVVAVLTALGNGYAQGPADPPDWLNVDVAGPVAAGVVERFTTGDRAHDIDRSMHRPQVRATVNIELDQRAPDVGDGERDVLASFCLGSWEPDTDPNAERSGIASFVIAWYLAGR